MNIEVHFTAFDLKQRSKKEVYFDEFFVPYLRVPPGSINIAIRRKTINPMFKRIDIPNNSPKGNLLHGEKIQIHFADNGKSALNIDGTWKHGKLDLTKEVKETLIGWGFKLPK